MIEVPGVRPSSWSGSKSLTYWFCIDFRKLNAVTSRDAYSLPHMTSTLDKIRGARYLSTLNLKSGYWQILLVLESKPLTAFTVPGRGLMQFTVMPFGLHSTPATLQSLVDTVLDPKLEPHVFVYFDDIIIISSSFEEHLTRLREVFSRLRKAKLKINYDKCRYCVPSLCYLGHVVNRDGVHTDSEKVSAITDWPTSRILRQVRRFLLLASWYRRFVRDFASIAAPLTRLTRKGVRWAWGKEKEGAFYRLKQALAITPVLTCPDFSRCFTL